MPQDILITVIILVIVLFFVNLGLKNGRNIKKNDQQKVETIKEKIKEGLIDNTNVEYDVDVHYKNAFSTKDVDKDTKIKQETKSNQPAFEEVEIEDENVSLNKPIETSAMVIHEVDSGMDDDEEIFDIGIDDDKSFDNPLSENISNLPADMKALLVTSILSKRAEEVHFDEIGKPDDDVKN